MTKKKIRKKLDKLIGGGHEQRSAKKRLKMTSKLLGLLEQEELKYKDKLTIQANDTDTEKFNRKLKLIYLYLEKGKAYRENLISEIESNVSDYVASK
jgi:hypothetical protein